MFLPISSVLKLGGIGSFVAGMDKELLTPKIDGRLLGDIFSYLFITVAGAEMWQRAFAAKDRKAAKRGIFLGTALYAVCVTMILVIAMADRQLLPNVVEEYGNTDAVLPALAVSILPPGLTGLALASIVSVMMSTADSYLPVSMQTVLMT